jgi:hypothetical protein
MGCDYCGRVCSGDPMSGSWPFNEKIISILIMRLQLALQNKATTRTQPEGLRLLPAATKEDQYGRAGARKLAFRFGGEESEA